ncbi:MAG: phosphoribosyltransferase family protein [Lautropia sp.]|nr:phosphoribosyltransferase family protein [Lautropia sp.]
MTDPQASVPCPYHIHFSPTLDEIICLADYAPPLDQVLGCLKFGQQAALGKALGELLIQKAETEQASPLQALDALIPIPLSGPRLAERGFNQSHQIARGIRASSSHPAPPIQTGWLRRIRQTAPQSTLAAGERAQNLSGAFEAAPATRDKQVALIDDVMTTGATLLAAAQALKDAGAARVIALIVARTPEPGQQG